MITHKLIHINRSLTGYGLSCLYKATELAALPGRVYPARIGVNDQANAGHAAICPAVAGCLSGWQGKTPGRLVFVQILLPQKNVGWVKERSDVPIKIGTPFLMGTLRFTHPTKYIEIS